MNLPYYRTFVVTIDDYGPVNAVERTAAGAAISAAVQLIPSTERRGWPDTFKHHTAHVLAAGGAITEIAVWFDTDGHARTYTPGEAQ